MLPPRDGADQDLVQRFESFVRHSSFPCLGAKSALARGQLQVVVADDIGSAWDDGVIHPELLRLAASYRADPRPFQSLAVVFRGPLDLPETAFERHLWARLQSLSDRDDQAGLAQDPRASGDPASPHFSVSFGGEAFFVVGLHPGATRPGRRFEAPVLVFNLHAQFEQLRAAGTYEKLRTSILQRDLLLAGSANPMLSRFGETSEARQYSGRAVNEDWVCPFRGRQAG